MRWPSASLILILISLAQPVVCQNQQTPRGYEKQSQLWRDIKEGLLGPGAEEYFEALKFATIPGGIIGVNAFEGILVSSTPSQHPNEFLVAMSGEKTPEVTVKLKSQLDKPLPAGTPVRFAGVVTAFTREPFMLTVEVKTIKRAVPSDDTSTRKKDSK